MLTVISPLVRVPEALRDQVLTLCRLHREGLPVEAALEQAIASLQSVDNPVNSSPPQTTLDDLTKRVEALEKLTALLTPLTAPVNTPVSKFPKSVNNPGDWLTVEDAWAIARERGCPASLSTFRRWARGNAKYPHGDEASLQRWGFRRDLSRATAGHPKNPARFLQAVAS